MCQREGIEGCNGSLGSCYVQQKKNSSAVKRNDNGNEG